MIRPVLHPRLAWLWLALAAAALCACASQTATSSTTTTTSTSSPTAHPTAPPTGDSYSIEVPTPVRREGWTIRPLSILSPSAAKYAEDFHGCCIGVAVAVPSQGVLYTMNGDEEFAALSVAKVPIMLAFLEKAATEGREITEDESELLTRMIRQSDNDAADAIWNLTGGAKGVNAALTAAGIKLQFDRELWGESLFTADQIATLLSDLMEGDTFQESTRDTALQLLESVVSWQSWGASYGAGDDTTLGIKNGWYLEPEGWALNTTAYFIPEGSQPYTMAIFSLGMKNYASGIAELESIAARIHGDLQQRD